MSTKQKKKREKNKKQRERDGKKQAMLCTQNIRLQNLSLMNIERGIYTVS